MPLALTIILMVIGTILTPFTHIVGLIGLVDLCFNLKSIIKNDLGWKNEPSIH